MKSVLIYFYHLYWGISLETFSLRFKNFSGIISLSIFKIYMYHLTLLYANLPFVLCIFKFSVMFFNHHKYSGNQTLYFHFHKLLDNFK
jgi:hypothetical protein